MAYFQSAFPEFNQSRQTLKKMSVLKLVTDGSK